MIFIFTFILVSSCLPLILTEEYSYADADEWENEYPQCGGSRQSPINLGFELEDERYNITKDVRFLNIFTTVPEKMVLKNDGHTLKILFDWPDDEKTLPYVTGGPLKSRYITHSFQFRWGSDVNSGSEHTLGTKSYAMEMQVVHYSDKFDSYEEAEAAKNGLMINSFFIKLAPVEFDFLTFITEKIPEVALPGQEIELEPFPLGKYFRKQKSYTHVIYPGSLTHPPCYESVMWIITDVILPATEEQVKAFENLVLFGQDDHNNRPLQEPNGRHLTFAE